MGSCSDADVEEFFRTVPNEKMLVRSGITVIKYWFSISDEEQHLRFQLRIHDPIKQWKLSPMDLELRRRWEAYTKAKEAMLERTHIPEAPWWIVEADDKSVRVSTASIIYWRSSLTTKCRAIRWCCRTAFTTLTISVRP